MNYPAENRGLLPRPRSLVRPERSRSRRRSLSRRSNHRGVIFGESHEGGEDDPPRRVFSFRWWTWMSQCCTCLCCASCLKRWGKSDELMQQAWREKMTLCLIIFIACLALGFLTFGLTTVVCRPPPFTYKHSDMKKHLSGKSRWFIIHGTIYNVPEAYFPYPHPDSPTDPYPMFAGQDITVFFPHSPSCQAAGHYFRFACALPGYPLEFCHSMDILRKLDRVGRVNWDWSEIEKSTTRLAFNGYVLDIGYYLNQVSFNSTIKPFGQKVDKILRTNIGGDATKAFLSLDEKTRKCLLENFGSGTVDVLSVGCIFTDIVLYVSLVTILAVILIKFILAVWFSCFLSRRLCDYEAKKQHRKKQTHADSQAQPKEPPIQGTVSTFHPPQSETQDARRPSLPATLTRSQASDNNNKDIEKGISRSSRRPSLHTLPSSSSQTMPASRGRQPAQPLDPTLFSATGNSSSTGTLPRQFRFSSRYAMAMQRNIGPRHSHSFLKDQFPNIPDTFGSNNASEENPRFDIIPVETNKADLLLSSSQANSSSPLTAASYQPLPFILVDEIELKLDSQVNPDYMYTILVVTCYSEGESGLRNTIESLVETDYPDDQKLLFIVADGLITGSENEKSTPQILIDMMEIDKNAATMNGVPWSKLTHPHGFPQGSKPTTTVVETTATTHSSESTKPKAKFMSTITSDSLSSSSDTDTDDVWLPEPYSYVAIADGTKRHNMARVFAGHFYSGGHKVAALVVVKCGTPSEAYLPKPGNRGKRDSQIILMSFLSKVLFDDRMTPLEYDMYLKIKHLMGVTADQFESVLCVDADTVVIPDCLTHMTAVLKMDPQIMGLCGETKIANKMGSWVTAMQVFEYFISHHLNKAFESIFGGVTCLPGCFCMYRVKSPKGPAGYWVPILASPDIVDAYSENVTDTLHKKNLLLLGEDRYLTTLMLKTFPKRKLIFVPSASCKTLVPDSFSVLLSQRRRWINSTVHNLFELVLVPDLCGTFCCSMQFVIFMELVGTLVLPAAIVFTGVLIISSVVGPVQIIPLALLAAILGLPAFLIFFTQRSLIYAFYMIFYLFTLPIWNFVLPVYAYWHFDDFSWGETRKVQQADPKEVHGSAQGTFDSSHIYMRRWREFAAELIKSWKQKNELQTCNSVVTLSP